MKLFDIKNAAKIYVYKNPVNMGASFPKLKRLVKEELHKEPVDGDLFMFFNEKLNYVKILFYHAEGYCIFAKKISLGSFKQLNNISDVKQLPHLLTQIIVEKE